MPKYNRYDRFDLIHPLPRYIKRDIFDIPFVEKQDIDLDLLNNGIYLTGIQNISNKDKYSKHKIIHCYKENNVLNKLYDHPLKYIDKIGRYYAICTPDFSAHNSMDWHGLYDAVYKNRYCGALWQIQGMIVCPTIQWTNKKYYDLFFSGIRPNSMVSISTLGVNNEKCRKDFLDGYRELRKRFNPKLIICLGRPVEGMDISNIVFFPYEESFGNMISNNGYYQPSLFNYKMEVQNEFKRY